MQWKSRFGPGLFFLTLLGLAGCGGGSEPTEPPPPTYGRVRVACPQALGKEVVKTYGRNWEAQTKGTIEIVPYDPSQADPPDADLWIISPATMPRWAAAGKLRTLPESIPASNDYLWKSLLTLYREKLVVWDRKRYALPLLGESLLCCYRSDWLADPQHQKAFKERFKRQLAPPATWEEFADIAEYFAQAGHGPSLPPQTADDDALEREFYTIAANYASRAVAENEKDLNERALFSFQYDIATGEPRIATGGFLHALRLMKRLQPFRAPGGKGNPADTFADGNAVFCLVETPQLARFQEKSKVKDKFSVCRMPGADGYYDFVEPDKWVVHEGNRIPYLGGGGWLGVVPTGAEAHEAAFSLLTYLSDPAVSKQIVIDPRVGGGPTRQEHFDSSTPWATFGLDTERTTKVEDALRQMLEYPGLKNPAVRLRTPDEATHRKALEKELRAALQGDKEPEAALQDAAKSWAALDQQKGMAVHQKEYRISLGLLSKD
jgi:ABC-type glycerol-3-phosphate transport system substrate-binding protein